MKVSAIVVTYNRVDKLKICLQYLLKQSYALNNIIVINNASKDSTKNYLKHCNCNNLIVKNMSKNVGGSGGFSEGIRLAYTYTDSDLFWLMDDDAIPTINALSNLLKGVKRLHGNFGFLCSNVRLKKNDFPCNLPSVSNDDWSIYLKFNLIKVLRATFVSYMIPRNIVAKLGLPVRQMFIWGDDTEYSLRISNYKPCYFVSNSIVLHNSSNDNASVFQLPSNKNIYLKYSLRNNLYAARKHMGFKRVMIMIIKDIYLIVKAPFVAKNLKFQKMFYLICGLFEGLYFNPNIEFPKK